MNDKAKVNLDKNAETESVESEAVDETVKCTRRFDLTVKICAGILIAILIVCILQAGVLNLILDIVVALTFIGLFATIKNALAKLLFGICSITSTLRIFFTLLGKYGFIALLIYAALAALACKIAKDADEKEDIRNQQY